MFEVSPELSAATQIISLGVVVTVAVCIGLVICLHRQAGRGRKDVRDR